MAGKRREQNGAGSWLFVLGVLALGAGLPFVVKAVRGRGQAGAPEVAPAVAAVGVPAPQPARGFAMTPFYVRRGEVHTSDPEVYTSPEFFEAWAVATWCGPCMKKLKTLHESGEGEDEIFIFSDNDAMGSGSGRGPATGGAPEAAANGPGESADEAPRLLLFPERLEPYDFAFYIADRHALRIKSYPQRVECNAGGCRPKG